jgi:hypothetical protein
MPGHEFLAEVEALQLIASRAEYAFTFWKAIFQISGALFTSPALVQ